MVTIGGCAGGDETGTGTEGGTTTGRRGQSSSRKTHRARNFLVVGEVALASFALVAAGFVYQSFHNTRKMRLGFEPRGVLLSNIHLSDAAYDLDHVERFFATVQSQFKGEARAGHILTLDQLNRAILRWALAVIMFPIQEPSRRKES